MARREPSCSEPLEGVPMRRDPRTRRPRSAQRRVEYLDRWSKVKGP